mgnify:CR=1 FL=1
MSTLSLGLLLSIGVIILLLTCFMLTVCYYEFIRRHSWERRAVAAFVLSRHDLLNRPVSTSVPEQLPEQLPEQGGRTQQGQEPEPAVIPPPSRAADGHDHKSTRVSWNLDTESTTTDPTPVSFLDPTTCTHTQGESLKHTRSSRMSLRSQRLREQSPPPTPTLVIMQVMQGDQHKTDTTHSSSQV